MISAARRPVDSTLRSPRGHVPWATPIFNHPFLSKKAEFKNNAGLGSNVVTIHQKKPKHSNDKAWLDMLARARTEQDVDAASYAVLKRVHDILMSDELQTCDMILQYASVERLHIQVLLALLASTLKAKKYVTERAAFYSRVEQRLRRDEPERVDALLRGLR